MLYTIEEISKRVVPVARKHRLAAIYLFGSYANGTATESSDVDLLVDIAGTSIKGLFALGALYCELEDALEKKIDVITVQSLQQTAQMSSEIRFRETIWREKVNLYAIS